MEEQREDYLLRLIAELRRFVASVIATKDPAKLEEALVSVVQAQERLFGRPAEEFRFPDVNAQLALLSEGETQENARAKCLAYATIMEQAGLIYEARGSRELAESAFQLALYVRLIVADQSQSAEDLQASIAWLVERVPAEQLHAPVLDLLERVNGWG